MEYKTIAISTLLSFYSFFSIAQTFQSIYFPFSDLSIDRMSHGDFNGDSLPDFLIVNSNSGLMQIGINNGLEAPEFKDIPGYKATDDAVIIDIDEDGDLDIIGRTIWEGVYLYLNDGNAIFDRRKFDLADYETIKFSDVTGDGNIEVIVGTFELAVYKMDKTSFNLTLLYAGDFGNGVIGALNAKDLDNDGDLDIIVNIKTSGLVLFEQTAPLMFETKLLYDDIYDAGILDIANINNDNIDDFVLYSYDNRHGKIVLSEGSGQYSDVMIDSGFFTNTLTLVGDLNADNKQEVIVFEFSLTNGFKMSIYEYEEELTELLVVEDHLFAFAGGITDLDNDGDTDFYFFQINGTTPGLVYYLSDGLLMDSEGVGFNTDVEIYPNPAKEIINIDVGGDLSYQVNLYDLEGRLLMSSTNTKHLVLDSTPKGTYLLEIKDKNSDQKVVRKIIIWK